MKAHITTPLALFEMSLNFVGYTRYSEQSAQVRKIYGMALWVTGLSTALFCQLQWNLLDQATAHRLGSRAVHVFVHGAMNHVRAVLEDPSVIAGVRRRNDHELLFMIYDLACAFYGQRPLDWPCKWIKLPLPIWVK